MLWKLEQVLEVVGIEASSSCCFLGLILSVNKKTQFNKFLIKQADLFNCFINNNVFIFSFPNLNYGGCSLMAERKIYKLPFLVIIMNKRVCFSSGNQKKFIRYSKNKSKLRWKELSKKLKVNENTLSKSYMFELCNIPYNIFKEILVIINKNEEDILKRYNCKIKNEKVVIGRKVFGERKKILAPIIISFENTRLNLNISKISYSRYDTEKGIKLPSKITPELAEEIGMQFGDGFLSSKRYDYRLKGNPYDEKEYYLNYIKPLFKKLYNLDINLKEYNKSYGFEVSSKALWEFKTKVLNIKTSPKYEIRIPEALKVNNKEILTAFIRGLFDTDGCVSFKTKYGYEKYYPSIEIALTSKKLIKEVAEIIKMFGFNPSVCFNERYGRICIYGISAFKRYEELIGWSSQKNLNKVKDWKNKYPELNGECRTTVNTSGCGPLKEGSTPSFRP